jgi:hypothetical protein
MREVMREVMREAIREANRKAIREAIISERFSEGRLTKLEVQSDTLRGISRGTQLGELEVQSATPSRRPGRTSTGPTRAAAHVLIAISRLRDRPRAAEASPPVGKWRGRRDEHLHARGRLSFVVVDSGYLWGSGGGVVMSTCMQRGLSFVVVDSGYLCLRRCRSNVKVFLDGVHLRLRVLAKVLQPFLEARHVPVGKKHSIAINAHQCSSALISAHQRSSALISAHQRSSMAFTHDDRSLSCWLRAPAFS